MRTYLRAVLLSAFALAAASCQAPTSNAAAGNSAAATDPDPAMNSPDETAWTVFITAVSPVGGGGTAFETWASDTDTFTPGGKFPGVRDGLDVRPAVLPELKRGNVTGSGASPHAQLRATAPGGAAPGEAPTAVAAAAPAAIPDPPPSEPGGDQALVEEVRRNQPAFDYIVGNNLNSRSGLVAAFKADMKVSFPENAIEVKTNWLPVSLLGKYYPGAKRGDFYVVEENGQPYALLAMHVISKLVPNWTWATFEHQLNPGRCDFVGCVDLYGAAVTNVAPVDNQGQNQGTIYPPCAKSNDLQAALSAAGVDPVFNNYCLKGSQADFTDNSGLAIRLGNSVTEYGFVWQASCMTCHGVANFTSDGQATTVFGFLNNQGQLGAIDPINYWNSGGMTPPIYQGMPGLVRNAVSADFVWSIPFCAYDDVTDPNKPVINPRCVGK